MTELWPMGWEYKALPPPLGLAPENLPRPSTLALFPHSSLLFSSSSLDPTEDPVENSKILGDHRRWQTYKQDGAGFLNNVSE